MQSAGYQTGKRNRCNIQRLVLFVPADIEPMASTIDIDFASPYRVNGSPARFQSVWLLLCVYYAQRMEGASLPVSAVRARFPGNANLRMLISRAFTDFAHWGVAIGWGDDRSRLPALLPLARRSRGPFWMDASNAERLRVRFNGDVADMHTLAHFLGLDAAEPTVRDGVSYVREDVTYWNHLTHAMRVAQDGFPIASDANVAESFHAAQRSAQDDFQAALAILKESLAWRKHGNLERSREALGRLARFLGRAGAATSMPTFSAMAFIARGWNFYSRGELVAANAELDRLAASPELHPVVRYNPRVRFEYLNLRALVHKAMALNRKGLSDDERIRFATQAMASFSEALQAAYEADSIEAAQDVAANIGLTLWLCWQNGLIDPERAQSEEAVQKQALRWLGLSEWICDRFGVGGDSAWNTIFLLRIVRGRCYGESEPDRFRSQSPLTVQQVRDATSPFHAPFSRAKGYTTWSSVAAFALEEHDAGRTHYGPLQLANLLLESAWFCMHEKGLCKEAYAPVERLAKLMAALQPKERRFFSENLKTLPEALQTAAKESMPLAANGSRV